MEKFEEFTPDLVRNLRAHQEQRRDATHSGDSSGRFVRAV
jgi:hypothetical protein